MEDLTVPQIFKIGEYLIYFWINEPEKKVIVTDVIYARRDQVDAMADMPMT